MQKKKKTDQKQKKSNQIKFENFESALYKITEYAFK